MGGRLRSRESLTSQSQSTFRSHTSFARLSSLLSSTVVLTAQVRIKDCKFHSALGERLSTTRDLRNSDPPLGLPDRDPFVIVRRMVWRHPTLNRFLAIVLPTCSAWLFIACVSLCIMHSVERQTHCTPTLNSVCVAQDADCCPITFSAPMVLAERRVATLLVTDHHAAVVPSLESRTTTLINTGYTSISASGADPPFERFLLLRI